MSILRGMTSAALVLTFAASPALAQQVQKPAGRSRDSVVNGALIGAAAGIAGAFVFTRINCGPLGYDPSARRSRVRSAS